MKNLFSKSLFYRLRAGSAFLVLALVLQQSSANAFISLPVLNSSPASSFAASKNVQNFSEITDKVFVQTALTKLSHTESDFHPTLSEAFRSVVGIYTYENKYRKFSRIVFDNFENRNSNPYLAYEILPNGNLGALIESGVQEGKNFIRERIYDSKSKTVTLYNRKNVFEKSVYELKENGEPGRPLQFRGRLQNGNLINLAFLYQGNTVTCIYLHGMTFATYEVLRNNELGNLILIGSVSSLRQGRQFEIRNEIGISFIPRGGKQIPVYVFKGRNDNFVIRERLSQNGKDLGAIGRVLRYKSAAADLEYFYQDHEELVSRVWVYNHKSQETVGFEISKKDLAETSGRLTPNSNQDITELWKGISLSQLSLSPSSVSAFMVPESLKVFLLNQENLPSRLILGRLLRGPPSEGHNVSEVSRPLCFRFLLSFYSPSYIYSPVGVLA